MRVLMCGGGTGGHINPAIAIANEIKNREDSVIEFVGTSKGLETKLVPKAGYKLNTVKVMGFKRKLTLRNFKALLYAFTSVGEAKRIIKKHSKCETATDFQLLDIKERNKCIKKFKEKGVSIRQISRLTGISKGIVERI